MELIRKILFTIEQKYVDVALYNLKIDGYDLKTVAYHCELLYEAGMIKYYNGQFYDDELQNFTVGSLTWEGHDFLDKIRDESIWEKTKTVMKAKGLPFVIDVIKQVATAIITEMTKAAIKGF